MTLINEIYNKGSISKGEIKTFITLLNPFAPHITEEMWEVLGFEGMLNQTSWPTYDEAKTVDATVEIAIQVNGKLRGTLVIPAGESKDNVLAAVKKDERIAANIEGKTIIKEIYVPNKLANIVVK